MAMLTLYRMPTGRPEDKTLRWLRLVSFCASTPCVFPFQLDQHLTIGLFSVVNIVIIQVSLDF